MMRLPGFFPVHGTVCRRRGSRHLRQCQTVRSASRVGEHPGYFHRLGIVAVVACRSRASLQCITRQEFRSRCALPAIDHMPSLSTHCDRRAVYRWNMAMRPAGDEATTVRADLAGSHLSPDGIQDWIVEAIGLVKTYATGEGEPNIPAQIGRAHV